MGAAVKPGELKPEAVFRRFAEIAAIPRASGNEGRIGEYLLAFARDRSLEAERDAAGNVLIRKPGQGGGEKASGVILQSHMDMVAITAPGSARNMAEQGVALKVDGDYLGAEDSTLGADNGIGMAFTLALLEDSSLPHPPLEGLFTVDEETGMGGALAFDASTLRGEYFINMDSEEEGVFYGSCAGGARLKVRLPVADAPAVGLPGFADLKAYSLGVSGLRGGHSGAEIHRQNGNAHRLLGRVLQEMGGLTALYLSDVAGGVVDNAIPFSSTAVVLLPAASERPAREALARMQAVFREELLGADGKPDADGRVAEVVLSLEPVAMPDMVLAEPSRERVVQAMNLLPHGVAAMELRMEDRLVETSSNFALVSRDGLDMVFTVSVRSSLASKKEALIRQIELLADALGATVARGSDYPGWRFNPDSRLRRVFLDAYRRLYGCDARVTGIHAGLECGVFDDAYRKQGRRLDLMSLGPDLYDVHTPAERIDIPSAARTWELLREVVASLAGI